MDKLFVSDFIFLQEVLNFFLHQIGWRSIYKIVWVLIFMKVIVYSTQSCPWCKKTKEFLSANKIRYSEKDVGNDTKAAREMIKKSGQTGVPVIEIGNEIIVGFNERRLKKILGVK